MLGYGFGDVDVGMWMLGSECLDVGFWMLGLGC